MTIQVSPQPDAAVKQGSVDRASYLTQLLDLRAKLPSLNLPEAAIALLDSLHHASAAQLADQRIPSAKDEEWRFTDLSPLLQVSFAAAQPSSISEAAIAALQIPEAQTSRLVFVDGLYAPNLSVTTGLPDSIVIGNLEQAVAAGAVLEERLGQQQGASEIFTSLNSASFTDAAVVWVPRNQVVETPIQLLFISTVTGTPTLSHPRCLVVAETGSSITLVETYGSLTDGVYWINPVSEIWVEANAQVNHTRVQWDNQQAFHIGKTAVSQARDSRYACHAISLGGAMSRHHLEVYQTGEQTETTLNGLTLIRGEQEADTHSAIAYHHPHGTSHQLHKCIVDDRAHAVFNGKVSVPKLAQLTDAGQLSKNLLLSSKARVDTKPQLEITADNVKCSHGATVSQLEADEVFYLQSRGIDEDSARKLLVYAFAYEVIARIPVTSVCESLAQFVRQQV